MDQPSGGANVLVVDDTIENLRLLSSILSERGHEVRPATSGRLALEAAESSPPEVILLDVSMPDMDGLEVCARLKQHETLRDIPVIFLTALADTADKVRAFEAGGADYITKPFQVEEVLARVDAHVALRRSRAALQASFDQLSSLERLRDDLTNMIVHDIRSPLGALSLLLDHVNLDAGPRLGEKASRSLQGAMQAAGGISRLVNDLLDVSRLQEGKLPLDPQAVDIRGICLDSLELLRPWAGARQLTLSAPESLTITCDPELLRRVTANLVGNAIKHTSSNGSIHVCVSSSTTALRVEIRDDGHGVPPEARDLIFDRYATLTARTEHNYHSAGLGLTFCRLAVEAHGGRIGVDGAEPRGSVFWFELPLSAT